ncbi:glycosyltransferase family 1 protein [Corynebacterium sp. p3-SID1194]|uniref:glycosyltransferase family 4 protein n=1 Tax=Corynebacterium sp. p3-SID1194 TaxID=2916105 RepID=UPI0021A90865|nr:glycosyltransferase family 1 protein [Corynebacterium sp. p3-SID1194]MCT1450165.1 glycosyltransferase family 1 protein [Corynebacterium sp. p3-SID1194]
MRIAIFTEVFLPKIDGVVTRVIRTVDQLAEIGHEVMIFATGDTPETYAGFPVVRVPSFSFHYIYPEIKVGLPAPAVAKKLKDFNPDVIHAVNPVFFAGYGAVLAKLQKKPLLASFHTDVPAYTESLKIGLVKKPATALIRAFHNCAEMNLVTSDPMLDTAKSYGLRDLAVWPKAVDTVGYHPDNFSAEMRDTLTDGNPDAPLLIYVGRMSAEKNLAILNDIMPLLREKVPGARLAMVGAGPQLEQMKKDFDPAYTVFTGYMSGTPLAQAFASADVFAFPSLTETLGLVALESFASGVPVVGARAGGIPFVIEDGQTGMLVDKDASPEQWADAFAGLLIDAPRRTAMSAAARTEAERWSWRAATEKLVEYYEVCTTKKSADSH